ncbi:MAG: hypothetical protein MI919_28735, partial [Holophagales bacterium]|nr:hypothetical protein [Holophagales bacterium]
MLEAAALRTAERQAFLRQLTATDPALLQSVHRRLEAVRELPTHFLSTPVAELLEAIPLPQETSGTVGPTLPAAERYELGEELGRGGMATVYSAFDRLLERQVALKLLDPGEIDAVGRERFLAEARAQARVRHGHVLEIFDTGAMELGG